MSRHSTVSFGDPNGALQANILKVRQAKLKKLLLDMATTSGKVKLSDLKQALHKNNIVLTNQDELAQFEKNWQQKVKVDSIMQWIKFVKLGSKDQIYATISIPTINELNDQLSSSHSETQNSFWSSKKPSRPKSGFLRTPSRRGSQLLNKTLGCSDTESEADVTFTQENERTPVKPTRPSQQTPQKRPVSAAVSRKNSIVLKNTPSKLITTTANSRKGLLNHTMHEEGWSNLLNTSSQKLEGLPHNDKADRPFSVKKLSKLGKSKDHNRSFDSLDKQLSNRQLSTRRSASQRGLGTEREKEDYYLVANITEYKAPPLEKIENPQEELLVHLTHDIQKKRIEYKYVFGLMNLLMTIISDKQINNVSRELFEREALHLKTAFGATLYKRILDLIVDSNGNVSADILAKLVDRYKYNPYLVKHFKNTSEQFQDITLYGAKIRGNIMTVHHNCRLLARRIEEKFVKLTKAYRFFDLDKSAFVRLPEFQHGLDLLGFRWPTKDVKDLFEHLDRKHDGYLDYDEFCDILEERRLMKGVQANHTLFSQNSHQKILKGKTAPSPYVKLIRANIKEDPKFVDHRKEESDTSLSEYISLDHKKRVTKTISLRKTSVGLVKKMHNNLPSDKNTNHSYGMRSEPTESMKDIMANNYQKEWLEKAQDHEEKREERRSKSRPKKYHTDASILRSEHIKKMYPTNMPSTSIWKVDQSSRNGSKFSISRRSKLLDSTLNSSFMNQNSYSKNADRLNISVL